MVAGHRGGIRASDVWLSCVRVTSVLVGRQPMSVSVRVVDCVYGKPAIGVLIRLSSQIDGTWTEQWRDRVGEDGRSW